MIRTAISIFLLGACLVNYGNAIWIGAKARLAQHLIESSWSETLKTGEAQRPWEWADTWPVARLIHEPTSTDLYVLEGADGSSLAFGPGHMSGTSMPGEGASVIGGHRDTHFQFLREVKLRDELLVQSRQGDWKRYQIDHIDAVDSTETPLRLVPEEDRLILVTCYPFDNWVPGGPMRYVVQARLAEPDIQGS